MFVEVYQVLLLVLFLKDVYTLVVFRILNRILFFLLNNINESSSIAICGCHLEQTMSHSFLHFVCESLSFSVGLPLKQLLELIICELVFTL